MAGIPVTPDPSTLMRGGEALNRSAPPVSRLAALLPVLPTADGGVAPGDNTLIRAGVGTAATERGGGSGAAHGQTTSTRETLSFAARAILHVLDGEGMAAPPGAPVLRSAPSGTPAQLATALRQALPQLLQQSGLFYESHLADWVQGARPLAEVRGEPQARLASPPAPHAPAPGQAGGPMGGQPHGAPGAPAAPVLLLPAPSGSSPSATLPMLPGPAAGEPGQAKAEEGAARPGERPAADTPVAKKGARQLDPLPARSPTELLARQTANAAVAYESVAQGAHARPAEVVFDVTPPSSSGGEAPAGNARTEAPAANPIHPATEGLVRQQLELLATQQFRWSGEAWPDVPMEWEVSRRQGDTGGAADEQPWSTKLVIDLPRLGRVEARLTLNGTGLEATVSTVRGETASRLNDSRSAFSGNLSANGLVLMRLTVSPGLPDDKRGRP